MPTCPKCGSPMKIKYLSSRLYVCTGYPSGNKCYEQLTIKDDEALSIGEIAADMAISGFLVNSDERRKEQTQLRKSGSMLSKLAKESKYLSDKERVQLCNSAEIIERLATAAEKSKKVLKAQEDAEKKRVEQRHAKVLQILRAKYAPEGWQESLKIGAAMSIVRGDDRLRGGPYEVIRNEMRRIDKNYGTDTWHRSALSLIKEEINTIYRDAYGGVARHYSHEKEPIEVMTNQFIDDVEQTMSKETNNVNELIEELNSFMVRHQLIEANKSSTKQS